MDTTTIYDFHKGYDDTLSLSDDDLDDEDYSMAWNIPRYWELGNAGRLPPLEEFTTDDNAPTWNAPPCLEEPVHDPPVPPVQPGELFDKSTVTVHSPFEKARRKTSRVPCEGTYLAIILEEATSVLEDECSIQEDKAHQTSCLLVRCFSA